MTFVAEQNSEELRAHMRRLKAMCGWNEPLSDRLFKEVVEQDVEIERLNMELTASIERERKIAKAGENVSLRLAELIRQQGSDSVQSGEPTK